MNKREYMEDCDIGMEVGLYYYPLSSNMQEVQVVRYLKVVRGMRL